MDFGQKNFRESDLFDFTSLARTFFNFLAHCASGNAIKPKKVQSLDRPQNKVSFSVAMQNSTVLQETSTLIASM